MTEPIRMVDISGKKVSFRKATAVGTIRMSPETLKAIKEGSLPKGSPLPAAQVASFLAIKRTAEMIPLCHPIPITASHVSFEADEGKSQLRVRVEVTTQARTGAEMEALFGVAVALLTIYDMGKGQDPAMVITDVRLEEKTGGRSGQWRHPDALREPVG